MRRLYEAGLWEWDALLGHWYSLTYVDSNGETQVWEPPFPGAPRRLTSVDYFWGSTGGLGSEWVTLTDLQLPPALARHSLTNPFPPSRRRYEASQVGFYPPLKSGVNVVWAAGVDFTDPSLRPECPAIARMEVLHTGWVWPMAELARSDAIRSYEEFQEQAEYTEIPVRSGMGTVWSEELNAAFWRFTASTPYGWYTFDIETMKMRPVDTAPDSWDTLNLWEFQDPHALGIGVQYYNNIYLPLPPGIEPWPSFDPWSEVVPWLEPSPVPGPAHLVQQILRVSGSSWAGLCGVHADYLRVTRGRAPPARGAASSALRIRNQKRTDTADGQSLVRRAVASDPRRLGAGARPTHRRGTAPRRGRAGARRGRHPPRERARAAGAFIAGERGERTIDRAPASR